MQIIHVSDTHLGATQYGLEERERDFYDCFNEFVERVLEEHVHVVIHSGDVFHSARPSIAALRVFQQGLSKLHERGVKTYAVPGGHDTFKRRGLTPLQLFDYLDLTMLTRQNPIVVRGELLVAGIEYTPQAFKESLVQSLNAIAGRANTENAKYKVLVLHQALGEVFPPSYELTLDDLPRGFTYYAMGHVHHRTVINRDERTVAYPGSLENLDLQEAARGEEKGFFIVDLSGSEPQIDFVKIDGVRPQLVREVRYEKLREYKSTLLREAVEASKRKKPILHLRIVGRGVARGDVDRELVRPLAQHTLAVRVYLAEEVGEETVSLESVSLPEVLEQRLKNREMAMFVARLVDLLSGGEEAVKDCIEEAEKVFRDGSWKRWVK